MFEEQATQQYKLNDSDIIIFTTKDSGPGGQHRNKTESCVIMRHEPTGIEAKAATKSQPQNKKVARELLEQRVSEYMSTKEKGKVDENRKEQVGSGMRGDKIRTYREQDGLVTDHRTDTKFRLKDVVRGNLELLYK